MSVTFTWDNDEQNLIRFIFDRMWQVKDLHRVVIYSQVLIEERSEVVDVIVDMSACDSMPSNLSDLRNQLLSLDKDSVGVMVFVTQNTYVQKAMLLLNQLMRNHFSMHFTTSLQDAHRIAYRAATTRQGHISS